MHTGRETGNCRERKDNCSRKGSKGNKNKPQKGGGAVKNGLKGMGVHKTVDLGNGAMPKGLDH